MNNSRRSFLHKVAAAPLVNSLGLLKPGALGAAALVETEEQFDNPHIIKYDASCFTLNGRDTFIFSGAFHYPRCPKALWRDRLEKFKRAGFNTIETYVFWNYHEREEGKSDLSEFEEFVQLVKEMGFWMIARPGPYVCAEWERGGFPNWIAAQRFPLRSPHSQSIETSKHWYDQVLPVIMRHQITVGGPIIMVQVENEYDFWQIPDAQKLDYIRALANMVVGAGITVPIITCWTRQARQNSDPYMATIMDTCNFYPRWDIVKEVPPKLALLRKEEPNSPVGVTELQGGWFAQFGEKLSVEQEGVNGAQLNMISKVVIEQGATYFNYYMGFGGTNFDWAAQKQITSYDYAAPIREPGGLWEKYYAARGVGASLAVLAEVLPRAKAVEKIPQSTNPNVSVTERASGKSGVVFVRENANAEQRFKMIIQDPFSPTMRIISAPREGQLVLGAREMKMLPVGLRITGSILRYTTAEVLAHGLIVDRHYLIVYDEPGRVAEISVASADEPKIQGDYAYNYWDQEFEAVVIGVKVEKTEKILLVNNHLLLVVLPRELALRTWTAEFPTKVIPYSEEPKPMAVPFITDAYQLAASGSTKKFIWAELDFQPGEHSLTVLLPPTPAKTRVDGLLVTPQYDRPLRTTRLNLSTPPIPYESIAINQVQTRTEKFDVTEGEWQSGPLRALEEFGPVPYGYVKYRAQFNYDGQPKMFISTFGLDSVRTFVNGKLVSDATVAARNIEFALAAYAAKGNNTLEISCERFGSANFGPELSDLSGVESVRMGKSREDSAPIENWQVQRLAMRGNEINPQIAQKGWQLVTLGEATPSKDIVPAFAWCRAEFATPTTAAGWTVPWKLMFEADRDALLYLNGKFLGRYVTVGPQKEFYIPEPYFEAGRKQGNVLMVVLAYTEQPHHIHALRVAPYEEFAAHRTRIEFEW